MRASSRSFIGLALLCGVLFLSATSHADRVAAPTLDSVLAGFAQVPGLTAQFTEQKRMAILAAPLRTQGNIAYMPARRFVRRTTQPNASTVLIDNGELRVSSGARNQRIDLTATPVVRQFIDSFLAVMRGDKAALQASYQVAFSVGANNEWSMHLSPNDRALQRIFASIVLDGQGNELRRLTVIETNGDESETTFTHIDARHRFSATEAATVFSLP